MHGESLTRPAPLLRTAPRRRFPLWGWLLAAGVIVASSIASVRISRIVEEINRPFSVPARPSIDLFAHFFDATPLRITTTVDWLKFHATVSRNEFLSDPTIWQHMHFEDWDRLPADVRKIALQRMLYRTGTSFRGHWDIP